MNETMTLKDGEKDEYGHPTITLDDGTKWRLMDWGPTAAAPGGFVTVHVEAPDGARRELTGEDDDARLIFATLVAQQQENERLREGLKTYGVHREGCPADAPWPAGGLCSCGFDASLSPLPSPHPPAPNSAWVACAERVPDERGPYIVFVPGDGECFGYYYPTRALNSHGWYWSMAGLGINPAPTHWRHRITSAPPVSAPAQKD